MGRQGGRGKNAIYKAINASTEAAITQLFSEMWPLFLTLEERQHGHFASNQARHRGWGKSHKGRGTLPCSSQLELRKIISRASQLLRMSWRKPRQRFHSSHFLLLNFKAHIYVPQVAHEPWRVKQFGVDGRGTFSRLGTFRNTISSPGSLPSNFSCMLPRDAYS